MMGRRNPRSRKLHQQEWLWYLVWCFILGHVFGVLSDLVHLSFTYPTWVAFQYSRTHHSWFGIFASRRGWEEGSPAAWSCTSRSGCGTWCGASSWDMSLGYHLSHLYHFSFTWSKMGSLPIFQNPPFMIWNFCFQERMGRRKPSSLKLHQQEWLWYLVWCFILGRVEGVQPFPFLSFFTSFIDMIQNW